MKVDRVKEPFLKRPLDFIFSGLGVILSSWLWAFIWMAIWFEDGSPCWIVQPRIGRYGKIFNSLKFRTMRKASLREKVNIQATKNDTRITRVGRALRKTAWDELPQLLNIFFGQMSFVGPRALLPAEVEHNDRRLHITDIPGYHRRILVRPGLTGIAQVFAPRDLPRKHKFKYDLLYIRKMNFLLDLKLVVLSFMITLSGNWERKVHKLEILARNKTAETESEETVLALDKT